MPKRSDKPTLGEIRSGWELGLNYGVKHIYAPCIDCGKPRWIRFYRVGTNLLQRCRKCMPKHTGVSRRMEAHNSWKTGRHRTRPGYIKVKIGLDNPLVSLASPDGYAMEHRIVMAKYLGRLLDKNEVVHHKNGIKDDNRIENLELSTKGAHIRNHSKGYADGYAKGLIDGRERQIEELRKEIRLLHWQLKERGILNEQER